MGIRIEVFSRYLEYLEEASNEYEDEVNDLHSAETTSRSKTYLSGHLS
jgi:hypothetical protein